MLPDLQLARDYFIATEIKQWIRRLADEAVEKSAKQSLDFAEILEMLCDEFASEKTTTMNPWAFSWKQIRRVSIVESIKALLVTIRRREAPWQIRAAINYFDVLSCIGCEVHIIYEVDHVRKRIIVTHLDGIPGQ